MPSSALRNSPAFYTAMATVFVVAAFWLLYNAAALPIWYDETITLLELAGNPSPSWPEGILPAEVHRQAFEGTTNYTGILQALYDTDVHPPLYYLAALTWAKLGGGDLFSLRLISALCVLGAGLILARCAAPQGRLAQVLTVLIFFGAPITLWAGVNARGYGLAMLLVAAAILACTRELSKEAGQIGGADTLRLVSLAGLFGGLAFLTHYLTLLLLGPLFALLALLRLRCAPLAVFSGSALYALCGIAVAPMLLKHLGARPDAFSGFGDFATELTALVVILFAAVSEPAQQLWISLPQFLFFLTLLFAATIFILRDFRRDKPGAAQVLGLYGFCCGLFLLFLVSDKSLAKAGGLDRYSALALPFLALLIGRLPIALRQRSRALAGAAIAAIAAFIAVTWWDGELRKAQWINGADFAAVAAALPGVEKDRALMVVPRGHGRGMPGTWAHELPPAVPMVVVRDAADFDDLARRIDDYDLFAFGGDLSGRSLEDLAGFKARLLQRGFVSERGVVFTRAARSGCD